MTTRSITAAVFIALASACTGQSGSEVESPPKVNPGMIPPRVPPAPHCPCDLLRDFQQIRATVVAIEDFSGAAVKRYRLVADEIISDASDGAELQVGDSFGGYWGGQLPCGSAEPGSAGEGDDVIAFFRRGMQDGATCCERLACDEPCYAEYEPGEDNGGDAVTRCRAECEEQTAEACAAHRPETFLRGELLLVPWGESLVIGASERGTAAITPAELAALKLDVTACKAQLDDRFRMLVQSAPAEDSDDSTNTPSAPLPTAPSQSPSGTLPDAGAPAPGATQVVPPPVNPASEATAPPASHPEDPRIRCAP